MRRYFIAIFILFLQKSYIFAFVMTGCVTLSLVNYRHRSKEI